MMAARRGLFLAVPVIGGMALWFLWTRPPGGYGNERTGEVFRDCPVCPEMLPLPGGTFAMGGKPYGLKSTMLIALGLRPSPKRTVTIGRAFAAGRSEVTFDQWEACAADGGCGGYRPPDEGWGRGSRPVIHVSWNDAHAYARWLSQKTGDTYRLLTEAEWEYGARAGSDSAYGWGPFPSHEWANYGAPDCPPCTGEVSGRDRWLNTAPVAQFPANAFGLHDMSGNVYEWVEDCHVDDLSGSPADGSAVVRDGCGRHTLRGGAWYSDPGRITSSYRAWQKPDQRDRVIGFRVAKTIGP